MTVGGEDERPCAVGVPSPEVFALVVRTGAIVDSGVTSIGAGRVSPLALCATSGAAAGIGIGIGGSADATVGTATGGATIVETATGLEGGGINPSAKHSAAIVPGSRTAQLTIAPRKSRGQRSLTST
jgi:hypothetical protein